MIRDHGFDNEAYPDQEALGVQRAVRRNFKGLPRFARLAVTSHGLEERAYIDLSIETSNLHRAVLNGFVAERFLDPDRRALALMVRRDYTEVIVPTDSPDKRDLLVINHAENYYDDNFLVIGNHSSWQENRKLADPRVTPQIIYGALAGILAEQADRLNPLVPVRQRLNRSMVDAFKKVGYSPKEALRERRKGTAISLDFANYVYDPDLLKIEIFLSSIYDRAGLRVMGLDFNNRGLGIRAGLVKVLDGALDILIGPKDPVVDVVDERFSSRWVLRERDRYYETIVYADMMDGVGLVNCRDATDPEGIKCSWISLPISIPTIHAALNALDRLGDRDTINVKPSVRAALN